MTSKHPVRNVRLIWTITNKLYIIYKGVACHFNTSFLKQKMGWQKCLVLMGHVKDLESLEDFAGRNEIDMVFAEVTGYVSLGYFREDVCLYQSISV